MSAEAEIETKTETIETKKTAKRKKNIPIELKMSFCVKCKHQVTEDIILVPRKNNKEEFKKVLVLKCLKCSDTTPLDNKKCYKIRTK